MQTFLPYSDFAQSAAVLDMRRLGKQRVEALQILRALDDPNYGWQSHPAVRMWRGYTGALAEYGLTVCREWVERGYRDTCFDKIEQLDDMGREKPDWLYDEKFLLSHRSNLVRKQPDHYRQFFPDISDELPYVWPV